MKLSSLALIAEYRETLKTLREAHAATKTDAGCKINCKTWYHGADIDFNALLPRARIKAHLEQMIQHEINETVRSLEAHGVVVDE